MLTIYSFISVLVSNKEEPEQGPEQTNKDKKTVRQTENRARATERQRERRAKSKLDCDSKRDESERERG